jgi:hypothetical protein
MQNNNEPNWLSKYNVLVLGTLGLIVAICLLGVTALDVATKNGWIPVLINPSGNPGSMPIQTPKAPSNTNEPSAPLLNTATTVRIDAIRPAQGAKTITIPRQVEGIVSYPDIWVDDELLAVWLVCPTSARRNIKDAYFTLTDAAQQNWHYTSQEFLILTDSVVFDFRHAPVGF